MADIAPELVERMANHLRYCIADIPDRPRHDARSQALWDELKAITDLLPTPVDPNLIEAREMFIEIEGGIDADRDTVNEVRRGAADQSDEIVLLLKGIKRGRELAREQGK